MFGRLVLCLLFLYQTTLTSETLNSSDDINVCSIKTANDFKSKARLRVISNFGDSGEIHFSAPPLMARLLARTLFRARACISQESPKL